MKTNFLILILIFTVVGSTCQTAEDSLALDYFLDDDNLSKMQPCELVDADSIFSGRRIWYINTKYCPDYCYEPKNIQLFLISDSISWSEEKIVFFSSKFERLHKKSALYSGYVIYQFECGDETFRIYVNGRFNDYYLLECYRFGKVFKRRMKFESMIVIKAIN